jgi:hypothetical protein
VRQWNSPDWPDPSRKACRYRAGVLIAGDAQKCPPAAELIVRSYPAGCAKEMANGASVARCKYE